MQPEIVKAAEILSKVEKGNVGIAKLFIDTHDKIDEISTTTDQKIEEIKSIAENTAKQKGEKGDTYILTDEDKSNIAEKVKVKVPSAEEIAKKVKVPVVEKVIEKIEVIKEQPIHYETVNEVTNNVENKDTGEQIVEKINSQDTLIKAEKVEGLKDFKKDIKELKERPSQIINNMGGGASGVRDIRGGTNVTVTKVNEIYTINSTASGGASAFTDLTDAPSTYTGQGTKVVTVKADETGLEFAAAGGISDGDKGDITVSSSGTVWTVDNGLAATKIADGTVSNTEFQYINSLSSNAQDQLDAKLPYTIPDNTARDLFQYRPATLNSINGTGTIVVLLDDTSTTTNKYFAGVIRGHNYTGRNEFQITFSALWYNASFIVASPVFLSVEGAADFGSVRFAYDASNRPCLLIGTTGYTWHGDSRVTLEQLYSSYADNTEYQRIRDNAPVQAISRITSETGYTVRDTKAVSAVNSYTSTSLVKVWGGATPVDYRYSIYNPINLFSSSNTTGTVAIKLPAFVNTVYNIIEVRGFDYTSTTGGWRVTVSGLNTGTSWVNSSVNVEGKPPFTSVRLAYIGADYCILLGTTATTWGRMNISLDLHHKVGATTDPIYTNATDYSITTAITSEASYSVKATYDCAFNAQRFYAGDGTAALPSGSYYGDTDTGSWRPAANTWAVSTGGTERMRIDSSGMVRAGAGTIGLLIDGAGASFQPLLGSSTTSAVSGLSTGVNDGTNNRRAGLFVDQTNAVWGLSHLYASGRIPFVMMSNTTEQFRVDTSHNFGIGTGSTISARLHAVATTEQQRLGYDASNYFSTTVSSAGAVTFNAVGSGAGFTFNDGITMADAKDISFNTTTGTKIGTATTQKLGFWNATPIVQPTTAITAATFVANTSGIVDDTATFDGYTIGQVVKALRNAGLLQ